MKLYLHKKWHLDFNADKSGRIWKHMAFSEERLILRGACLFMRRSMIASHEKRPRRSKYAMSFFLTVFLSATTYAEMTVAPFHGPVENPKSDAIERLQIMDINDKLIDISLMKGKTILFILFDPLNTNHKESVSYAQVLHGKYHHKGFEVIGISNRDKSTTRELFVFGNFSFPFVSDEKGMVYEKFQMKSCCGGVVILNKKTEVVFKFPHLASTEDLRQLTEKEILGRISYSFKPVDPVNDETRMKKILRLPLLDISKSQVTDLMRMERTPFVVTLFSTFCSICKSGKRIDTLKKIREKWAKEGKNVGILLIFSKPYMERDILEIGNRMDLPFGKFISLEDIFSDEEKYITDDSLKIDPITVVINKDRSMVFIEHVGMREAEIGARIAQIFDNM